MPRFLLGSLLATLFTASTLGQVTDLRFVLNEEVGGGACDIVIDFEGQFTGVQLLVQLATGTINLGSELFPVLPNEGDVTFITTGNNPVSFATVPSIAGAAVDLGGGEPLGGTGTVAVASPTLFDVAAFVTAAQQNESNFDETDFIIGRLGVSDDANGTVSVLASAGGDIFTAHFILTDGVSFACVPEPATAGLWGVVGCALIGLRRRHRVA
ncbi:MAG: hypothetical protein AAF333_10090 [Planctomycetota bacterium]